MALAPGNPWAGAGTSLRAQPVGDHRWQRTLSELAIAALGGSPLLSTTRLTMFDYHKCERCRAEYHPSREDQSYCSPRCRRDAAYTRRCLKEGRRAQKGHLATPIARSVENGPFCPIETIPCKPTESLVSTPSTSLAKDVAGLAQPSSSGCPREDFRREVGRYRSRPLGSPFLTFCFLRSDSLQGNLSLRGQHNEGRGRILSLFGVFSEVVFHPRDRLEP